MHVAKTARSPLVLWLVAATIKTGVSSSPHYFPDMDAGRVARSTWWWRPQLSSLHA